VSTEEEDDWRYWKAAVSCLPTQETRDVAWEFFVRHFSQNPKMADTLSGLILVMQANGLYMLEAPRMVREQIVDPLHEALTRFSTELNLAIDRHKHIATEATRSTERAVAAIMGLEGAICSGWQESTPRVWPNAFKPNWRQLSFNRSQSNAAHWNTRRPP
jgi:hypothetical protein